MVSQPTSHVAVINDAVTVHLSTSHIKLLNRKCIKSFEFSYLNVASYTAVGWIHKL